MDAHWRAINAESTDFFNYGLTPATWKDYCRRVQQFRLEFTMQRKIQTYEGSTRGGPDPDLPPELRAAVAAEHSGAGSGPSRGMPLTVFSGARGPPREARDDAVRASGAGIEGNARKGGQGPNTVHQVISCSVARSSDQTKATPKDQL